MLNAINWKDDFFISRERIVLTNNEIKIPGFRLFATHKVKNAILPLVPHYHESAFEFTLVVKGSMSFYTGKEAYTIPGGSVFVSFPDEIHSTNDIPISLNHQYWIQLDISDPAHFLFLEEQAAAVLIADLYKINEHVIALGNPEVCKMIARAFDLCRKNGSRLQIAACLLIFLEVLVSSSASASHHPESDIETAVVYINDHITEELSLDGLARLANLSTSQFKQKFRRVMGVSPRNYINQEKISRAKSLLLKGHTVIDVAMQLSFNDSSYFSTVFRKYTLKTPRQYVNEHRNSI